MQSLEISILKAVAYFDIFSYPLTIDEIIFFLDQPATEEEISLAIEQLIETKNIWQVGDFYAVRNQEILATRRINGNLLAKKQIKKAATVARFLYWLPYVKGVAISGSLSKNFADKNSDLDFFIIAAANRLWIVRVMQTFLCKAAFLIGVRNWFCPNYFIDELDFKIKEQNIFTAVEISTLMPLKGLDVFDKFYHANRWVKKYQPNYQPNYSYLEESSPVIFKKFTEWLLNSKAGDKIDNKLLSIFEKRFAKVLAKNMVTEKGITVGAYEACKHSCKPLPQYFQPKILAKFYERFSLVKERYSNQLAKAV